ncbi:hypothetical protein EJ06DRAFT_532484, partial [Trichodelitschia bisporula]
MSVRVGIGVFAFQNFLIHGGEEFIIGKRKGSHGAGTYALPGGHLEFGETFEHCAARELLEETGIKVDESKFIYLTAVNSVFEGKHYVTIMMGCLVIGGSQPQTLEPDKCEGWGWMHWKELKECAEPGGRSGMTLFAPMRDLVHQRDGFHPFEVLCEARRKNA